MEEIRPIEFKDNVLHLIDQRKLPTKYEIFQCRDYRQVEFAIRDMVVRGAPAIGVTAAYGLVLAVGEFRDRPREEFFKEVYQAMDLLRQSRPTAVNLMWALERMKDFIEENQDLATGELYEKVLEEANTIYKEDIETNRAIGRYGNEIVKKGDTILTHCNAGALATAGYGTALGVIRAAHYSGKNIFVYADETRPRLQGGKLTAWELVREKIACKLIADNVAASLIRDGEIDLIIVGADRIASNGDTANKIGTFMLSVVAKAYNVPFYIAAPISTIDFDIDHGDQIVIEERSGEEVTHLDGLRIAPEGVGVYNPAFDITPYENISGIITEKGIIRPKQGGRGFSFDK